jgi:HPt (histidine-containing phosphotransfer) domain-containing protein
VILMDISMPGIDGFETANRIRAGGGASREAVIVAQTAHAEANELKRFKAAGMQHCLIKPFRADDIEAVLKQVAASGRPRPIAGEKRSGNAMVKVGVAVAGSVPGLDMAKIDELQMLLGKEGATHALARFAEQVKSALPLIRTAERAGDCAAVASLCHKLAGSAGVLGADRLYGTLKTVETAYREESAATNSDLLDTLEADMANTIEQMQSLGQVHNDPAQ